MANVEVILTESVRGVGRIGEIVRVSAGYARNFLIPRGLAEHATESNRRRLNGQLRARKIAEAKEFDEAQAVAADMEDLSLTIAQNAGESGRLFGSVTANDIAEALAEMGYPFDRRQIVLHEPIREVGSHEVEIRLHPQVGLPVAIEVVPTGAEDVEDDDAAEEPEAGFSEEAEEAPEAEA